MELARALWHGVVIGDPRPALAALFPQGAYEQLKAIPNPGRDWTGRLERDFELDVLAAHRLLGAAAATSTLVGVDVRPYYAHWIRPNSCGNAIGYYEMPGARVVYKTAGRISSFGIASMISWRRIWYVVHMGALHRRHPRGAVDKPRAGPGSPEYSGTC